MFEQYYDSSARIRSLRNGPGGSLLESFSDTLHQVHYCVSRVRSHILAAEHFIHFANRHDIAIAEVNERLIESFRDHQTRCRCVNFRRTERLSQVFGARLFLKHLRDTGAVTSPIVQLLHDVEVEPVLLTTFRQWMREQRGTSDKTLHDYCVPLRAFLDEVGGNPLQINARGLRAFVMQESRRRSRRGTQTCTTALRAFLRFLISEGRCAAGLQAAIPVFVHWHLASLPRYLQADEVERVIDTCDTDTSSGKRDRAILLLLARLGLRAGDIIRLRLGDIDWNEASVRVCGKGHHETRMPLTNEVGKAIVSYLKKARPQTNSDVLFVRCVAPFHPLGSHTAVSKMVAKKDGSGGYQAPEQRCGSSTETFSSNIAAAARRIIARYCGAAPSSFHRDHADLRQSRHSGAKASHAGVARGAIMLTQAIKSYVEMRQACGFSFRIQSCLLRGFAKFSDKRGERFVRTSTAVEWAAGAPSTYQRARRLNTVILLSRYLRAEDTRHELPHAVFGTEKRPRRVPYIFSSEDIQRLIRAAARSGYRTLRRETYSTLFSLLACTGLRVSEAINLRYDDIGPDGLVIRCSKFKTTRLIPAHETTIAALDAYLQRRRPYAPFDDHVFISLRRKPLRLGDVDRAFRVLAERLDLRSGPGVLQPSPHSLRHTFAVRALEACPADRDHVTKHMVALSTYLGHRSAAGTYWYLQGTPHLMTDIAQRCETFVTGERT